MHRLRTTTAPLAARILSPCLSSCLAICLAACLVLAAPAVRAEAATEESVSLTAGGTYQISLDAADDAEISYASSDTSVATVSADGTITAVGAGTADVIATITTTTTSNADSTDTDDGDSTEADTATGAETVTDTHTVHVTVTRRTPTITASNVTHKYTADTISISWSTTSDGTATFTSADTSIAKVSSSGEITTKGVGTTTITISVSETSACTAVSTTIDVTINSSAAKAKKPSISRSGSVITLTWAASNGAGEYAIFEKVGASGSWKRLDYVDASVLTYKVTGIKKNIVYSFRLRAFGVDRNDHVTCGPTARHIRMGATSSIGISNTGTAIELFWTRVEKATGYRVYRNGKLIATLNAAARVFYRDTSTSTAKKYRYGVFAWHKATTSEGDSKYATITRAKLVNGMGVRTTRLQTKASKQRVRQAQKRLARARSSGNSTAIEQAKRALARARSNVRHTKTVRVRWKRATSATKCQVQCSTNPLFLSYRTQTLAGSRTSCAFTGLDGERTWYVRMRVCVRADGKASWSAWRLSGNVATSKSAHAAYAKRRGKAVELRALAKQGIGKWDTVQGSCSDGTFGYYVLNRRSSGNCKILKVRLSTMRRVRLSGVLSIGHGNGIAYDSSAKRLVVHVAGKKFAFVNPTTLRVTKTMKVELGTGTWGVVTKTKRHFSAVAYCKSRRQYALLSSSPGSVLVTDRDLSPVKYLNLTRFGHGTLQSIACTDSYILIAWSGPNYIYVYDWSGKYVTRIRIGTSGELESVIVTGKRIFASVYNSRAGRRNYVLRLSF